MDEPPPPPYVIRAPSNQVIANNGDVSTAPPQYTFPESFNIGNVPTPPFVDSAQLKGHLALLHSFARLRSQMYELSASVVVEDKDRRWAWFVSLAVERFTTWCESLTVADTTLPAEEVFPPLDVIMVWHAYMLNPRWYAEDCYRLPGLQVLKDVGRTFATSISRLPGILDGSPVDARIQGWKTKTQREFDPLEDAGQRSSKTILCLKCRNPVDARQFKKLSCQL